MPSNRRRFLRLLGELNEVPQPTYPRIWCMAVLTGLVLAAFIAVVVAITGKSAGEMLVGYPTVFTLVWGAGGSVLLSIQRRAGG